MVLSSSEIDVKLRFLVLHQDAQWWSTRIAYSLNIPLRTVEDWISKINQEIDISQIMPGRGHKLIIPESTKENIKSCAQRKPMSFNT